MGVTYRRVEDECNGTGQQDSVPAKLDIPILHRKNGHEQGKRTANDIPPNWDIGRTSLVLTLMFGATRERLHHQFRNPPCGISHRLAMFENNQTNKALRVAKDRPNIFKAYVIGM